MRLHRLSISPTVTLVLAFSVPPASTQTAAPRDPAAASRVARDADNPLRMIIEASKLKPRAKPDADAVDAPPAPNRVVRAPKPAPVAKTVAPATETPKAASQPADPAPTLAKATDLASAPLGRPSPIVPSPRPQALALPPLKLAQLVEPLLPSSVMRRLRSDMEVVVAFTVNADGSVSDVAIRSSPLKALDASVIEAVRQWRYEPIGEARAHAVQLVMRASP
jgi:TonB family protein